MMDGIIFPDDLFALIVMILLNLIDDTIIYTWCNSELKESPAFNDFSTISGFLQSIFIHLFVVFLFSI